MGEPILCVAASISPKRVSWSILNAVKVPGQLSLRGQYYNAASMRKLVPGGIVGIVEAYCLGQALDSLGRASEKMPAIGRTGTPVAPYVLCLFSRSQGLECHAD